MYDESWCHESTDGVDTMVYLTLYACMIDFMHIT